MSVLEMQIYKKRKAVAESVRNKDYAKYNFRNDYGSLKAVDAETILMLLSVGQLISCDVIKDQIKEAIVNNELKDFILMDILTECDETFFDKATKAKTYKSIVRMDEQLLEEAFVEIFQTISY